MRGFPAAATPRRRAWPLVSRLGHISGHFGREPGRLSQVSGEPSCAFALLSDPAGADRPAMADGPCRSPSIDRESHPAAGIFRGSITRLRHPPPTLPASIALHGQGWLPAAWLAVPGGVRLHGLHPLGSSREFQWQFPCLSPPFAPAFAWRDDSDPDSDWGAPACHPFRSSVLRAGQGCLKVRFWHPFRVRGVWVRGSGGRATRDPRLRSGTPSG